VPEPVAVHPEGACGLITRSVPDERERLAAYAHEAWSGWMRYMFSKATQHENGIVTIPVGLAERWQRQMNTAYDDLPESEKASDRDEADKMLAIMAPSADGCPNPPPAEAGGLLETVR
jgi:hypothetical protein